MPNPIVAIAGASIGSAAAGANSAKKAAKSQQQASQSAISEQQAAREDFNQRTDPFRQIGLAAGTPLLESLGIAVPQAFTDSLGGGGSQMGPEFGNSRLSDIDLRIKEIGDKNERLGAVRSRGGFVGAIGRAVGTDQNNDELNALRQERQQITSNLRNDNGNELNPGADNPESQSSQSGSKPGFQSELERINPLVSFMRDEGFRDIQESAAAQSGLSSGGTLKDLTRFNTQLASTVVPQLQQQRFNQLFNVLGLGSNAAAGQGAASLSTASNIGNLMGQAGAARAQGQLGQAQAIQGGIGDLAGIYGMSQGGFFNSQPPPSYTGGIQNPNQFGNIA